MYPVGPTAGTYSRVVLNSATVVNVDSVQTFNAAYPGGAAQGSFTVGSTVYVRAVISDPFGSFDISLGTHLDHRCGVGRTRRECGAAASRGLGRRDAHLRVRLHRAGGAPLGGWSARVTGIEGTEGT